MKRLTGVWAAIALAIVLAATAGAALADNPHNPGSPGNSGNAPGQQKKDPDPAATTPATTTAAPTAQPTTAPGKSGSAPGQAKKAQPTTATAKPAKSAPAMAAKPAAAKPTTAQKPTTVTSSSASMQKANHTAADGSKKYGNGKSALEIAKQTKSSITIADLSEPGNSGKHKITICHNGHLITIDVHALQAHARHLDGSDVIPATSASQCQTATTTAAPQGTSQQQSAVCGSVTTTTTTLKVQKGHAYGLLKQGKPLHTKAVTETVTTPTHEACSAAAVLNSVVTAIFGSGGSGGSRGASGAGGTSGTGSGIASGGVAGTTGAGGVLGASSGWQAAPAVGGVAGVQATLPGKSSARGGVLGIAATKISGPLPFTGFPVWIAVLIALALLVVGATLVRKGRAPRTTT